MIDSNAELPQGYILRQAKEQDKWTLQKLVWEFQITETWDLDLRVIGYRLCILALLSLSLVILVQVFENLHGDLALLKLALIAGIIYVCFLLFIFLYSLFLLLKYGFVGAMLTWSRYWVIEYNYELVGCISLFASKTNASLGYLFVKPKCRSQGLATYLIKHLTAKTSTPLALVCKPKMIEFYTNLGFVQVTWTNLSNTLKAIYHIFRPHPKLLGFQLIFMQYSPTNDS